MNIFLGCLIVTGINMGISKIKKIAYKMREIWDKGDIYFEFLFFEKCILFLLLNCF